MIFTDTFDRADNLSSLGSPWTTHAGQFGVVSSDGRYTGTLEYSGSSGWPGGVDPRVAVAATVDVGSADMVVEWNSSPTSGHTYRLFRTSGATSSLAVGASSKSPNTIYLGRIEPSGNTAITSTSSPGWQTKRVRVETLGTSIKVYVDGTLTLSTTSSFNSTATRAGIGGNAIGWVPDSHADNFTRSDSSSLGSPWTAHAGTWGIASNRAKYVSGSGIGAATVDLGSPVQTVEWDWTALAKGPSYQIFRYQDIANFWCATGTGSDPNKLYLAQTFRGGNSVKATATGVTWGPGSTLRVEAGESNIKVYSGGTLVLTHTVGVDIYGSRAGIGGNMSDALLGNTRWSRFDGAGVDTDTILVSGGSGGPWLNDVAWSRFHCSPWPVPASPAGWVVGRVAW